MIAVNIEKAAGMLQQLVYDTINNCEETVIVADNGSVVMIDQKEWNNIQETLRLLNDKEALMTLLDGHKIRKQGGRPDGVSIEETFSDI